MARTFLLDGEGGPCALDGAVCAIGVFDGVHLGHRLVADQAAEAARQAGAPSAIVTFDVDPDELFAAGSLKKLQSNEERIAMLASLPVDFVAVIPFTRAFAALPPEEFLSGTLAPMRPSQVLVGSDFRFGHKAEGDVALLAAWGARQGVGVEVMGLLEVDGVPAKSTRIRQLLAEGDVRGANALLGRHFSYAATVRKGRGEGASMGFATANLPVLPGRQLPADGVYGCYAHADGVRCKAAVSVGVPPTFAVASADNVEAHLLGFEGDLYGRTVEVDFVERLRPMERFDDVDELIRAVEGDIAWIEGNL